VLRAAEPTFSSNGLARCSGVVSLLAVGVASGWRKRRGPLCAVRDCEPLLEWLKEMPATEGLDGLRIGQSTYEAGGLGVFAAKDFAAGELVCRVPTEALLISDTKAEDAAETLAQQYLQERCRSSSRFSAYWQSLPQDEDLAPLHPFQWPKDLQCPEYVTQLLKGSLSARLVFDARLGQVAPITSSEMLKALALVDSRSFNITDENGEVLRALVPFIDLFNTFVPLASSDNCTWNCWFRGSLQGGATLHTECAITAGTELVHCYGDFSSAELWATYGFLPSETMESPHEAPVISLPLECSSLAPSVKLQLEKMLKPRHWLDEDTLIFEIPWDIEEDGLLYPTLELMASGAEDATLRQRLEVALESNHAAEQDLLQPPAGPHRHFQVKLQHAAVQLLRNERPLLEDELARVAG